MSKIHANLTDADGLHLPKGFAAATNETALIKNSSGSLEYRLLTAIGGTGPQGDPGPPLASVSVANIANPAAELASESGGAQGDLLVVYDVNAASANEVTIYSWDAEVVAANVPYIVTGSGGTWIAVAGKYQNQSINVPATVLIDGRDVSVDGTKLDGIQTGATADSASVAVPPSIATSGSAGTDTNTYANADHTHAHGNQAAGASLHAAATTSIAGFMSATDKTKLDGIPTNGTMIDPSSQLVIYEDFVTGAADLDELGSYTWSQTVAGTAAAIARIDAVSGHPGILRLTTGTAATARALIYLGLSTNNSMILGGGAITFEGVFRITGTAGTFQRFNAGLANPNIVNGENTDGVYIALRAADTNWQLISRSGGTETAVDLGTAFSSGTWIRLGFVVNAGATSIQGFVNGVSAGTAITTNIPSVAISPFAKADALTAGGGSAVPCDLDYLFYKQVFSVAR